MNTIKVEIGDGLGEVEVTTAAFDTYELDAETRLVARVIEDYHFDIMDEAGEGAWCGSLEWSQRGKWSGNAQRPASMDGGARIIERDGWSDLWWQPPADCLADAAILRMVELQIRDLLAYGYSGVAVDVETLCSCCDTWKVTRDASVWGLGTASLWEHDVLAEVVGELLHELFPTHLTDAA